MTIRKITLLALLLVFLGSLPASGGDKVPTDERGMLSYAQAHANRRDWRLADRVLQRFIKTFPESARLDQAYFQLGHLHTHYSRRLDTAREWLGQLCEKFPKSRRFWTARFLIAEGYARQKDKPAALEAYRDILKQAPNQDQRTNAAHRILGLENKYIYLSVNRTFTEGEEAEVQLGLRNIGRMEFRAFRIPYDELLEHIDPKQPSLPAAASRVPRRLWQPVKEWVLRWAGARGDRYRNRRVKVPVKERGFYVVEAVHGLITMTVSFPVNRYGMIVKAAAGKAVVFAQDRVSGEPVRGMKVRIIEPERTREFTTDKNGLMLLGDVKPSALMIGVREGDCVFVNARTYGWRGKESRYYITTDRPIYRPNQKVAFKIVHRTEDGANLTIQRDLRVQVSIRDTKGNEVYRGEHSVDEYGACSGEFLLGDEPALGNYRIQVDPLVAAAPVQDWRGRFGLFRVDEYRKPEFKVGVKFKKPHYVQGDELSATISADYYFGSPVPNAAVQYRVVRNRYWIPGKRRSHWYSWYAEGLSQRRHYGETVAKGTGTTDENGELKISVPLPRWDHDANYSVVADVTDLSRRQVKGSGSVRAYRADFHIALTTDRYVYRVGHKIDARIVARDLDGKPVIGKKLTVTASQRYWRGKKYEEELELQTTGHTDQNGEMVIKLDVERAGYYILRVSGKDASGNETWTTRWAWVASDGWNAGHIRWQGVDVVPDKEAYKPGETATFLISSEIKDMTVLVTFESTRIHLQRVVKLNGNTKTLSFRLDDRALVPNFYVTVTALHQSRVYQRQRAVMVDPGRRFLSVEIKPNQDSYRPRDPAAFEIITKNSAGQPVAADLSLAIVDESIFALQPEMAQDIRRFFLRKRYNRVQTVSSLQYWQRGKGRMEKDAADEAGVGAPAAAGKKARARGILAGAADFAYAETEVRTRFADTMFWRASVVTDETGRAIVRIPQIADNLTTWRLTARAMTKDGKMGQATRTILVRKDIIVRLHTPRFFTQGDRTTLSAVVHNYLDSEKRVKIVISATGLELNGLDEQIVTIPAQSETRIDWPVVVRATGTSTISVKALTDEESDAMELKVPLLPHGSLAWSSSTHLVKGVLDTSVTIPEDSIADATELHIIVSPTHAATVLDSLEYLADYPYGCVEQTMSRFLPSAITAQVLRKLNLSRPELEKELPHMISQGLQRLYNFQQSNGGWGWWKHDEANPFTTAYVVYGLAQAQNADVAVSANVLNRGIAALKRLLDKAEDDETRVYLLHSLSAAGKSVPGVRNALADKLPDLSPVHKAMLAMVLQRDGEQKQARRVLQSLAKDAQTGGATVHFKGPKTYRWTGHNVETTALALKAFLSIAPDHKLVEGMVTWLAMARDGNHWVSTRQTAMVVFAMADYLARTGDLEPDLTLTLTVNGKQLYSTRVTKENWREFDGALSIDRALLKPGQNEIRLESEGSGTPICSIYLKHFKKADVFQASKGDLRVKRSYSLVRWSGGKRLLVPLDDDAQVKSGDEVQVTVTVTASRSYRYLMLEDPMPAGFEAVREQRHAFGRWSWWYSHKEFHDEKVAVAISHLPEGERSVTYTMRAETPGQFRVLPARVWNMYRMGEGANSAGRSLKVVDN